MQDAGQTTTIPETTTAGPLAKSEEASVDTVETTVIENPQDITVTGEQEKRYKNAVKRIFGRKKKGKPLDPWAIDTLKSKAEIAGILTTKVVAGFSLVDNMSVKQRLDQAIQVGEDLVQNAGLNPELRLKGLGILSAAAKISGELGETNIRMAERAGAKGGNGGAQKKRNLPPTTGVEVKMDKDNGTLSVKAVSTNGED